MEDSDALPSVDLFALVVESIVREELGDLDRPHLVICTQRGSSAVTYLGPFANGVEAVVAAEHQRESAVRQGEHDSRFAVAPIYPS